MEKRDTQSVQSDQMTRYIPTARLLLDRLNESELSEDTESGSEEQSPKPRSPRGNWVYESFDLCLDQTDDEASHTGLEFVSVDDPAVLNLSARTYVAEPSLVLIYTDESNMDDSYIQKTYNFRSFMDEPHIPTNNVDRNENGGSNTNIDINHPKSNITNRRNNTINPINNNRFINHRVSNIISHSQRTVSLLNSKITLFSNNKSYPNIIVTIKNNKVNKTNNPNSNNFHQLNSNVLTNISQMNISSSDNSSNDMNTFNSDELSDADSRVLGINNIIDANEAMSKSTNNVDCGKGAIPKQKRKSKNKSSREEGQHRRYGKDESDTNIDVSTKRLNNAVAITPDCELEIANHIIVDDVLSDAMYKEYKNNMTTYRQRRGQRQQKKFQVLEDIEELSEETVNNSHQSFAKSIPIKSTTADSYPIDTQFVIPCYVKQETSSNDDANFQSSNILKQIVCAAEAAHHRKSKLSQKNAKSEEPPLAVHSEDYGMANHEDGRRHNLPECEVGLVCATVAGNSRKFKPSRKMMVEMAPSVHSENGPDQESEVEGASPDDSYDNVNSEYRFMKMVQETPVVNSENGPENKPLPSDSQLQSLSHECQAVAPNKKKINIEGKEDMKSLMALNSKGGVVCTKKGDKCVPCPPFKSMILDCIAEDKGVTSVDNLYKSKHRAKKEVGERVELAKSPPMVNSADKSKRSRTAVASRRQSKHSSTIDSHVVRLEGTELPMIRSSTVAKNASIPLDESHKNVRNMEAGVFKGQLPAGVTNGEKRRYIPDQEFQIMEKALKEKCIAFHQLLLNHKCEGKLNDGNSKKCSDKSLFVDLWTDLRADCTEYDRQLRLRKEGKQHDQKPASAKIADSSIDSEAMLTTTLQIMRTVHEDSSPQLAGTNLMKLSHVKSHFTKIEHNQMTEPYPTGDQANLSNMNSCSTDCGSVCYSCSTCSCCNATTVSCSDSELETNRDPTTNATHPRPPELKCASFTDSKKSSQPDETGNITPPGLRHLRTTVVAPLLFRMQNLALKNVQEEMELMYELQSLPEMAFKIADAIYDKETKYRRK